MPKYGSVIDPPDLDATLPAVDASESETVSETVETNLMLNSKATLPDEYALNDYLSSLDLDLAEDGTDHLSYEDRARKFREEAEKVEAIRVAAQAKLQELLK